MIYFFDNCLSKKIVQILRLAGAEDGPDGQSRGPHQLIHLQEVDEFLQGPDTPDPEWMPYVAGKGWTAVTADHRIRKKPRNRSWVGLPILEGLPPIPRPLSPDFG